MSIQKAYDEWSAIYDSNDNKTRDLEAVALKEMLTPLSFDHCLEMGCGTGKNTSWFASKAIKVTAVDFSEKMLAKAREKIQSPHVSFLQADINKPWSFINEPADLVSFSLVLEHIEKIEPVIKEAARHLNKNGYLYIGELHPFKQYAGVKARFEAGAATNVVTCYDHHVSGFLAAATSAGFRLLELREYFDNDDMKTIPRILAMLFQKQ